MEGSNRGEGYAKHTAIRYNDTTLSPSGLAMRLTLVRRAAISIPTNYSFLTSPSVLSNLSQRNIMDHSHMDHGNMGHGGMDHGGMDHGNMCNMNVSFNLHHPEAYQAVRF
jgi:uncharacterized protein involved in copper resistance